MGATLYGIMNDAALVPRGALIKSASGMVSENKLFEGKQNKSQTVKKMTNHYTYRFAES